MLVVRRAVVGPFAMNAWLAGCDRTGDAILVDPGDEVTRVLALAEPGGFQVKRIVLTHGHIDHVSGAAEAREGTGAPLQLHPDDRAWLDALPRQAEMFGLEVPPVPAVDHLQADGETFRVGEHEARVLHTPGHSRGSCSIFFPASRDLFVGDTLFVGAVGRTDLPGGDPAALARSIREVLFPLGDDVRFHPGHGPSGTLGEERRTNPFVGERARRRLY